MAAHSSARPADQTEGHLSLGARWTEQNAEPQPGRRKPNMSTRGRGYGAGRQQQHVCNEEIIASLNERATERGRHGEVEQLTVSPDTARDKLAPRRRTATSLRMSVIRTLANRPTVAPAARRRPQVRRPDPWRNDELRHPHPRGEDH